MPLCAICQAIPYSLLPSEADAAYPHQPSVEALEASAIACPLCSLLLTALDELRASIANESFDEFASFAEKVARERKGSSVEAPLRTTGVNHKIRISASGIAEVIHFGRNRVATSSATPDNPVASLLTSQPRQFVRRGPDSTAKRPWLYGNWWTLDRPINEISPSQLLGIGVRLTEYPESHQCSIYRTPVIHYRGSSLRIFIDNEDSFAGFIPGRLREVDCQTSKALQRVRRWLQDCDLHHSCYPAEQRLPTRVLDLGESPDSIIKLFETDGKTGRYTTLSHCWGQSCEQFTTTRETLPLRRIGIAISELPRTFRDAVILTRKLRVRYLWIDSLCIIQNDAIDWEQEAPRMGPIYRNSYLTIAASDSTNSSDGCFPTNRSPLYIPPECGSTGYNTGRDTSLFVPIEVNLSSRPPLILHFYKEWMLNSNKSSPRIYRMGNYGISFDPITLERLSSRAWTLQERFLSPRTLHYGHDQMYWECKAYFTSEDGTNYNPAFSLDTLLAREQAPHSDHDLYRRHFSLVEGADPERRPVGRWSGGWPSIITDYSRRGLTQREDKLPALSGVAGIIASETGDTYLAGLWKSHLIKDLHWSIDHDDEVRKIRSVWGLNKEPPQERVPSRAPSWSWASVDACIKFEPLDSARIVAEVIGGHVTPAGNDPFGKVLSGWVVLKAPLFEIKLRDQDTPVLDVQQGTIFAQKPPDGLPVQIQLSHGVSIGIISFDFESHFPCSALFLDSSHCLVLKCTGRARKEFIRLGTAKFLRTHSQRLEAPDRIERVRFMYNSPEVSSGPIMAEDPREYVRII